MAKRETVEPRDLVSLLRTGEAPPEIRQFAARGLLPLDGDDQMRALLAVVEDTEGTTAELARATLAEIAPEEISRFLRQATPSSMELDALARHSQDSAVVEQIIRNKSVADETLELLARTVAGVPQEALIVNQIRLLQHPALIDALFENPELTADGRRRLLEIREEFFEKEERRKEAEKRRLKEAAAAAQAVEALGVLTPEEQAEVDAAKAEEGPGTLSDEDLKRLQTEGGVFRKVATMTVSEKIKLAYSGGKEERRILIGDSNKLVGAAVLKSRGITINEIEAICTMRHLSDDIFRSIVGRREWIKKPAVILAMVKNPKVHIGITMPLIKFVSLRDLRTISRDPNLAEALRITARKMLLEKRK